MAASVKEFLESYPVHERLYTQAVVWWNGQWPEVVEGHCRLCDATRSYSIWPSKVAGFTPEWGVYMLSGACAKCGSGGLLFWIEVNQREGWIQKAGQVPAPSVVHAAAS